MLFDLALFYVVKRLPKEKVSANTLRWYCM